MKLTDQDIQKLRVSYQKGALDETHSAKIPLLQFQAWFQEALTSQCNEPNAFVLSTIEGTKPRARTVLFKGFQGDGLVFYTHYISPKGRELERNPSAAATFLWLDLQRQIRLEGKVHKLSAQLSDDYFKSRPYGSQIGAWASPQGSVVSSRAVLEKSFSDLMEQYPQGSNVPRPATWGGYVLVPDVWEFWQGRENRLHDRIRYRLEGGDWIKERLAP